MRDSELNSHVASSQRFISYLVRPSQNNQLYILGGIRRSLMNLEDSSRFEEFRHMYSTIQYNLARYKFAYSPSSCTKLMRLYQLISSR